MLNRVEQICLKVELKSMSTAIDYFIFSYKLIRDFFWAMSSLSIQLNKI